MWPFALVNTSIPGAVDAVDVVDAVDIVDAVAAVVRVLWPLNNNYSIPYTAVQQYSSTAVQQRQQYSSLSHHTRRAVVGGFGPCSAPLRCGADALHDARALHDPVGATCYMMPLGIQRVGLRRDIRPPLGSPTALGGKFGAIFKSTQALGVA